MDITFQLSKIIKDLLYTIILIVNPVLYSSKFVKNVDLTLSVLIKKTLCIKYKANIL